VFEELQAHYSEPHRRYHTFDHLRHCLRELEEVPAVPEVELALWFHDFIYDTRAKDNEERSADRAAEVARSMKLSEAIVRECILATRHAAPPKRDEAKLVVDIDLSILGTDSARFDEYERQIREEYAWVPESIFRAERAKILQSLLNRPSIYSTERLRTKWERRAQENLKRVLVLHR
jgi:predicted metal-dependent HD superfamily phosphohydrolase